MSSRKARRLARAERKAQETGRGAIVVVKQSLDDPTLYTDGAGQPVTEAQIEELSNAGATVLRVVYVADWQPGRTEPIVPA